MTYAQVQTKFAASVCKKASAAYDMLQALQYGFPMSPYLQRLKVIEFALGAEQNFGDDCITTEMVLRIMDMYDDITDCITDAEEVAVEEVDICYLITEDSVPIVNEADTAGTDYLIPENC